MIHSCWPAPALGRPCTHFQMALIPLRRRRDGIQVREVVGDTLVLDLESGRIHQLNETAGFIWRACDEAPSVEELAGRLASAFEVGHDVALRDVAETMARLQALNLLVEA